MEKLPKSPIFFFLIHLRIQHPSLYSFSGKYTRLPYPPPPPCLLLLQNLSQGKNLTTECDQGKTQLRRFILLKIDDRKFQVGIHCSLSII